MHELRVMKRKSPDTNTTFKYAHLRKRNNLFCIFWVQISKIDDLVKSWNTGYRFSKTSTPNNVVESNAERSTGVKAQIV